MKASVEAVSILRAQVTALEAERDQMREVSRADFNYAVDAAHAKSDRDRCKAMVEEFWQEIERGFDIESREYFAQAFTEIGFSSAIALALHHIWKRDATKAMWEVEHVAVCQAVALLNMAPHYTPEQADAHRLLREALVAVADLEAQR
jgi:predicted glycosyl hydrolase (DUF1957 family)